MNRIIVGIDGSAEARSALRWAVAEAKLRGAHLSVVHAWTLPHIASGYTVEPLDDAELIAAARRTANDLIENALDELAEETVGLDVTRAAAEGSAAETLLNLAEEADLLVVGSRGRGGFTGLLLGSVSQQCAQHASCPVVIVPPSRDAATGPSL